MKSCFGLIIALLVFVVIIGGGALIWYLSYSSEFNRAGAARGAQGSTSGNPPRAIPIAVPVSEPGGR